MNKKFIIAAVITLFTSTASASNIFNQLDVDGSGSLNKKEAIYMPGLDKQWDALDSDKNGELTTVEFANYKAEENVSGQTAEMQKAPANAN